MLKDNAAIAVDAHQDEANDAARADAVVIDIDEVAKRRERLAAYIEATRPVVVYSFVLPEGAAVAAVGGGEPRDARNHLHAMVALVGGGVCKSDRGLAARIPTISAPRFERLAWPLIEAYLVSLDLGER